LRFSDSDTLDNSIKIAYQYIHKHALPYYKKICNKEVMIAIFLCVSYVMMKHSPLGTTAPHIRHSPCARAL